MSSVYPFDQSISLTSVPAMLPEFDPQSFLLDWDILPCRSPSLAQQADALRKGLGRAQLWARQNELSREIVLQACLQDWRYDHQCEASRAPWLGELLKLVDLDGQLREQILHHFISLPELDSLDQFCGLAVTLTRQGDDRFHKRLRELVAAPPDPDTPWLGESEILELEGLDGLVYLAKLVGRKLSEGADVSSHYFYMSAVDRWGEEAVQDRLRQETDLSVQNFLENKRREIVERVQAGKAKAPPPVPTIDGILNGVVRGVSSWAESASDEELAKLAEALNRSSDRQAIKSLLRVFRLRPMPDGCSRLIELCQDSDDDVVWRAFDALSLIRHPEVRRFGLSQIEHPQNRFRTLQVFAQNFEEGDDVRLIKTISDVDQLEAGSLHELVGGIEKILTCQPEAASRYLGPLAWRYSPCQICRGQIFRLLRKHQRVPAWMMEEAAFDAEEAISGNRLDV